MPVELQHAVIHSFTKTANTVEVTDVVKKGVLLDNRLAAVIALVDGVAGLLGKQGNSVTYGQFGDDMRQGRFPQAFQSYTDTPNDQAIFLQLSHTATDELAARAKEESLSTGGHILVASYVSNATSHLLVAMIKQRGGVSLDENYIPIEITEIDLSKVYQAARINLSSYAHAMRAAETSETEEESEIDRTYLCFLGQNKNNQASGYFITALGCTKGVASARATRGAIDAINKFFSSEKLRTHKTRARDAVVC